MRALLKSEWVLASKSAPVRPGGRHGVPTWARPKGGKSSPPDGLGSRRRPNFVSKRIAGGAINLKPTACQCFGQTTPPQLRFLGLWSLLSKIA